MASLIMQLQTNSKKKKPYGFNCATFKSHDWVLTLPNKDLLLVLLRQFYHWKKTY
jgi:hypothetical protein